MPLKLLRLEERIVLDAAAVDAAAAISDLADSTDSVVDGADTNSHDSDTDDATSQGSASGDTEQDSSNAAVRVLAISSDVDDPQVLASAAMEGVLTYIYDADSSDLDAILADIAEMLDGQQADSIAFASHSSIAGQFLLSGDYLVSSDTLSSDTALAAFWEGVGELVEDGGSLDILSCDAASGDEGAATLEALRDLTGVDVWGSDDATGNPDAGGDWLLEAGDVDLTARYFDADALQDYDSILASAWMVTDLNTTHWGTFTPYESAYAGGEWIVSGSISGAGRELFIYDSANETFTLLKDINPGDSSSNPTDFCVLNNVLYFQADDGAHGKELWKSDGTEDGTVLVKDINPGVASSTPHNLTAAEGRVFFAADDGAHGNELWKTNGSETYTVMVQDINPGVDSSDPEQLTEISGHHKPFGGTYLYFTANDGNHGRELWISVSGTTKMVEDINPGVGSSNPQDLTVTGDLPATRCLFYTADDGNHGRELWLTNSNGTRMIKDMVPGSDSGGILDLCEYDGDLYFVVKTGMWYGHVQSELWWHNGYGVQRLNSVNAATDAMAIHSLYDMGSYLALVGVGRSAVPSSAYVIKITYNGVSHGVTNLGGVQLGTPYNAVSYVSAGATDYCVTANHVYRLGSSSLAASYFISSTPVAVDDAMYFLVNSTLYRYGATGDRTQVLVERVDDNTDSSNPSGITNVGGTLYFYADATGVGAGLWKSDGTEAGTVFLKALGIDAGTFSVMDGTLYFIANGKLWTTDGTAAGTVSIGDGYSGVAGDLYVGDSVLYFRAQQGGSMQLFKSDGTPGGTIALDTVDLLPSWAGEIETMLYADGYLYYVYRSDHVEYSLKRTDGTVDGTITLLEPVWLSDSFYLAQADGEVYFNILYNPLTEGAGEIWKTDGTEAGTVLLSYMPNISNPVEYNGELYFQTVGNGVAELWKTDGTEGGTVLVKTLGGDTIPDAPMQVIDGLLYFAGSTAGQGVELWTSNGTEAGTTVVKDINTGSGHSNPTDFTLLDGVVYFTADDGTNGRELWRTDGTQAGTVLVKDVRTGSGSGLSDNAYLTVLGDDLYFAANDGTFGTELWTYATLARDDDFSFYEDAGSYSGNFFDDNGHGADSDNGGTITLTSANGAGVGVGSRLGNGTLTVDANGDFTYAIDSGGYDYLTGGQSVTLNFTYETLVNGISCTGHVTFTIQGRNTAPTAVDDTMSVPENYAINIGTNLLMGNDSDPEGGELTFVTASPTSAKGAIVTFTGQTVSYDTNGVAEFEALAQGQSTTDTFTYTVRDELGAYSTATVTVTINGRQESPEITSISDWSTAENAANAGYQAIAPTATVTDTDSTDYDGGVLFIGYLDSGLAEDSLTVMSGVYDTYVDGGTGSTMRLSILLVGGEVRHVRESQAVGSTDWVEEQNVVFATVTSDGQAGEELILSFSAQSTPELAQQVLRMVGYANSSDMPTEHRTLIYTLDGGDGGGNGVAYQVIQVTAENDGPVAGTVTDATNEDTSLTFNVADLVAMAHDPEGHDFSFDSLAATSANGVTLSLVDGVITYDPLTSSTVQAMTQGATAQDTFTYTLIDSEGATSTGTVTIDLTGINDAPEISGLSDQTFSENTVNAAYQYLNTTAATALDAEGGDLDGGVLRIDYADGGSAADWLRFYEVTYNESGGTRNRIYVAGTNVHYTVENYDSNTGTWSSPGSRLIGVMTSRGQSGAALEITFNQWALAPMAEAIVEAIQYRHTSDDPAEFRTLSYTLSDGDGQTSAAAEQVIRITPDNDAPTATDDTAFTDKDTSLTLTDLMANDSDPDLDDLSIVSVGASAQGATVTLNPDGSVTYDPSSSPALQALAHGATTTDTFTYTVTDPDGSTDTATVSVTVTGLNQAPTATDDGFATTENVSFTTGNVLTNDTDPDAGDTLTVDSLDTTGTLGSVTDNGDGTFDYDPGGHFDYLAVGETATDTFTYTVSDGLGGTDTATVTVTLTGTNDGPTATDEGADTVVNGDFSGGSTGWTTGHTGSSSDGTVDFSGGTLTITGNNNGSDYSSITYAEQVIDCGGKLEFDLLDYFSDDSEYYDYPVLVIDGVAHRLYDDGTLDGSLGGSRIDNSNDVTSTLHFSVAMEGNHTVRIGVYSQDGRFGEGKARFDNVTTYTYATDENSPLELTDVLDNDQDPDGDPLTITDVDATSANGALVSLSNGVITYDPNGQFESLADGEWATDTFTYTVSDGHGGTDTATVTIRVTGVNDAPDAGDDSATTDLYESLDIADTAFMANDTDVEGQSLSVSDFDAVSANGASISYSGGTFSYDASASTTLMALAKGDTTTDTFTYTVSDGHGGTSTATVTITVTNLNEAPTALDDFQSSTQVPNGDFSDSSGTGWTTGHTGSGSDGTVDFSNGILTIVGNNDIRFENSITYAEQTINCAGALEFDLLDYFSDDSEYYDYPVLVIDGVVHRLYDDGTLDGSRGGSRIDNSNDVNSTLHFSVAMEGNHTVRFGVYSQDGDYGEGKARFDNVGTSKAFPTDQDTPVDISGVLANDSDPEGDPLSISAFDAVSQGGGQVSLSGGVFTYDPGGAFDYLDAGETATDTFTYTIADDHGGTSTATVHVLVSGLTDAPRAGADAYAIDEHGTLNVTAGDGVLDNDSDPEGQALTIISYDAVSTQGVNISLNADGSFSYDPSGVPALQSLALGDAPTDTFTYTISDGHGGTATATVSITINGLNEAPVAVDDSGYTVNEDSLLTVAAPGILANDSDPDTGDTFSVGSYDAVSAYGATITVDLTTGKFTYDPTTSAQLQALAQGETVTDTFTYLILDQYGRWSTQEATVSILVTGVNDAPVAVSDLAETSSDTVVSGNLIANDVDVDHNAVLELASFTVDGTTYTFGPGATDFTVQLGQGTLHVWANGDYLFDPGSGYASLSRGQSALETFNYTVRDEHGTPSPTPATVTLNIQGESEDTQPINTSDGLFPDRDLREDTAPGPAPGGIGSSPGWNQVNGSSRGADQDVYIPSHGQALAMGLHLMGNRDTPYGPAYPDKSFDLESLLPNRGQNREAFNNALDMIPDVGQLTKIALKNFNVDILDIVADGDAPATQAGLRDLVHDIEMLVARLNWTEMARFQDVIEMWIKELKDQVAALRYADVDAKALMERLDALLEQIAAPAELEPL